MEAWTAELNPQGDLGRYLAERAAKVSWQLDRADSYEQACLARRVRRAERELDEGGDAEADGAARDAVRDAGGGLAGRAAAGRAADVECLRPPLGPAATRPRPPNRPRPWCASSRPRPAAAAGCSASGAGCGRRPSRRRGLRLRSWAGTGTRCGARSGCWACARHEVKLAAAFDRRLGLLAKVYAVVEDRACRKLLRMGCDDDPEDDPWPEGPDDEAEAPLPFDLAEVNREFRAIAEEQCARLRPLLARHEEEERDNRDDLPRRVSFDDSAEGERRAPLSGALEPLAAPHPRGPRAPSQARAGRGSLRARAGRLPALPGAVIVRIIPPAGPDHPGPGRDDGWPGDGRYDFAKQTHRGGDNVRDIRELRRNRRREQSHPGRFAGRRSPCVWWICRSRCA